MATPTPIALRVLASRFVRFCRGNRLLTVSASLARQRTQQHHSGVRSFLQCLKIPLTIFVPVMAASADVKKIVEESEAFYDKKDFTAMYDHLIPHKDSTDAEILWRLARAATEKGKMLPQGDERKGRMFEAWAFITRALEADDNNYACHKWYGILLDYTAEYEGTKKRIGNAFQVKEHFMKAIELNPDDSTTYYCLGYWCFLFADLPWIQRKTASLIFATPPTSTYEEALGYFEKAEKVGPGFYNQNKVMMGKTHMRLKDNEKAKEYLLDALKHEDRTADDEKARKEAMDLLKQLKVKF